MLGNGEEKEKKLREKYNPENIFTKYYTEENFTVTNQAEGSKFEMVIYEESKLKRIWNRIRMIFSLKKRFKL